MLEFVVKASKHPSAEHLEHCKDKIGKKVSCLRYISFAHAPYSPVWLLTAVAQFVSCQVVFGAETLVATLSLTLKWLLHGERLMQSSIPMVTYQTHGTMES